MTGRFRNLEFEHGREQTQDALGQQQDELVTDFLARATAAYHLGEFEEALRFYTRALKEDRQLIPAWIGQVQMLIELDECHEARVWAQRAEELFRGHGDLLAVQAQAIARLNDPKSALALSDAAMQAAGDMPLRWTARGEVMLARGVRYAAECFDNALNHPAATWFEGVAIARVCQYYSRATLALRYAQIALREMSTAPFAWLVAGECEAALGSLASARTNFDHALELRPNWPLAIAARQQAEHSGIWRRLFRRLRLRR